MSKRDLIDQIRRLNPTARPEFLAEFEEEALLAYLHQLSDLQREQSRHAEHEMALPVLA